MPRHQSNRLLDPVKALELKRKRYTWKEIGVMLAKEVERATPFTPTACFNAVARMQKGVRDNNKLGRGHTPKMRLKLTFSRAGGIYQDQTNQALSEAELPPRQARLRVRDMPTLRSLLNLDKQT